MATLLVATSLAAADVDVSVGAVGALNRDFGTLTPTPWRLHEQRGATVGINWFFVPDLSVELEGAAIREHVTYDGSRTGEVRSIPTSMLLFVHTPDGPVRAYIGAGVSYLMYRDIVRSPYGGPQQPDHAALMIGGGIDYALSQRWSLNVEGKYGPARSTAEMRGADGAIQKVDFHQLYISTGLRFRFH